MLLRGQAVLVHDTTDYRKLLQNLKLLPVSRVHLGEAEERGCGGSTRYGSNFIAGMLKYQQLNITTY